MNKILKQSFRIIIARISTSVLTLLFTVYFAYELPKHIFALIGIYTTIVNLSQVFIDLGLSTKVIRESPSLWYTNQKKNVTDTILMPSTILRMMVSCLICFLLILSWFLMTPDLSDLYPNLNLDLIVFSAVASLLLHSFNTILMPLFHLQKKFGNDSFLMGMGTLLENVFSMMMYVLFGMSFFFVGYFIANTMVFIVRYLMIRNILHQFDVSELSVRMSINILKEYFPFYLRRILRLGLNQADQLVILILLPLEQFANYDLAKKLSKFLKFYIESFINPLSVKFAQTKDFLMRQKHLKIYYLFTIPLPIILAILSPWIMKIAGGEKYADSWILLTILYTSYVFYAIATSQIAVITIVGKGSEALLRDAIGGMFGLLATFLMIYFFQEYGMAWGQLIAQITLCVFGYKMYAKYTKLHTIKNS